VGDRFVTRHTQLAFEWRRTARSQRAGSGIAQGILPSVRGFAS
jgi:hypothetical protein